MKIHFAPMQGHAGKAYRRLHAANYGGVDCYYTPFCRVEKGAMRRQDETKLRNPGDDAPGTVPQIIFGSADEFATLTDAIKAMGYTRIDLNLGCPFPMQTAKGRGAAMLTNREVMDQVSSRINADEDCIYSVKMRLGLREPDEWRQIMPVLNATKLEHVTVHPRVATQMYGGDLYMGEFEQLLSASSNPVVFNGDLQSVSDISRMAQQYGDLAGLMIGRGMLARPSLAAEWREGREWGSAERMEALMHFHDELLSEYEATLCGQAQVLQHIKPFWEYMEPQIGRKAMKAIKKAVNLDKYRTAINSLDF